MEAKFESVTIVGAGVAGLAMAMFLRGQGCEVEVLEQRCDADSDRDSLSASFNLTLNPAGRKILAFLSTPVDDIGQTVLGRCIHDQRGGRFSFLYGGPRDTLLSVPREELMRRLRIRATAMGVKIRDGIKVVRVNPLTDEVVVKPLHEPIQAWHRKQVLGCDGVYSVCREDITRSVDATSSRQNSVMSYTIVEITAGAAAVAELDVRLIQFASSRGAITIGLPNFNGSISIVMEFQGGAANRVIADADEAQRILTSFSNRRLLDFVPGLPDSLVGRRVRSFKNVECGCWSAGSFGLAGDAAHALPPYLGSGVNSALVDAYACASALKQAGSFFDGLQRYARERMAYMAKLQDLAAEHERALTTGAFGGPRWRLRQHWDRVRGRIYGVRTNYQQLIFDEPLRVVAQLQLERKDAPLMRCSTVSRESTLCNT